MFYYIDFEFRPRADHNELVCCCILHDNKYLDFWLADATDAYRLRQYLLSKRKSNSDAVFVAFAASAEMGCFCDLNLDPFDFNWLDLRLLGLPYRHSSYDYGKNFMMQDGRKGAANLVNYMSYFCNIKRDLEDKKNMILLIISNSKYTAKQKAEILAYCKEDIADLPKLHDAFLQRLHKNEFPDGMLDMSQYLISWVKIQREGIPLDIPSLMHFCNNINEIKSKVVAECNDFFTLAGHIAPYTLFKDQYVDSYANLSSYIDRTELSKDWPKTDTGRYKIDRETTKLFASNAFINIYRVTKQFLADMRMLTDMTHAEPLKPRKFLDYLSDRAQHPYYDPFGTLTGRCTPPAIGFIYANMSWMRIFIRPPKNYTIVTMDYSGQEVYLAAVLSKDANLMHDYLSGDIYASFAKSLGLIPKEGNKHTHPKERNLCKNVVLQLQYGQGANALSNVLKISIDEAKYYIEAYRDRYHKLESYKSLCSDSQEMSYDYNMLRLSTADGWWLSDNRALVQTDRYDEQEHFALKTKNFMMQASGAMILRHSIKYLHDLKLRVISTLHDEISVLCLDEDVDIVKQHFLNMSEYVCQKLFPGFAPCKIDLATTSHDDLYIEDKAVPALRRLSPWIQAPNLIEVLSKQPG